MRHGLPSHRKNTLELGKRWAKPADILNIPDGCSVLRARARPRRQGHTIHVHIGELGVAPMPHTMAAVSPHIQRTMSTMSTMPCPPCPRFRQKQTRQGFEGGVGVSGVRTTRTLVEGRACQSAQKTCSKPEPARMG